MSNRPNESIVVSISRRQSDSRRTSDTTPNTDSAEDIFAHSSATECTSRPSRPLTTTRAPLRANSKAMAAPMPELEPVIRATFPSNCHLFNGEMIEMSEIIADNRNGSPGETIHSYQVKLKLEWLRKDDSIECIDGKEFIATVRQWSGTHEWTD
ncbi:unnamed protein product, partial [Oppiella nova]